jgi:UDP-glucose 4-epimerase
MMKVLVTGGAGYVGSHTCVSLLEAGHEVVVVDNLSNGSAQAIDAVRALTGKPLAFEVMDIRDTAALTRLLRQQGCEAVVHFAGLKAVGESVAQPLAYYDNNVVGSLSLLHAMQAAGTRRIIFSSSATVYGEPEFLPYTEAHPTRPSNPYGHTKLHIEQMLKDVCVSDSTWSAVVLRYFNPVGAHHSGDLGESPRGVPNNLMPYLTQVASGRRDHLTVFGSDYDTPDGTCVRDYLHVEDLADGHTQALAHALGHAGWHAFNLGTGHGLSVLELVNGFQQATGVPVPYRIGPRRSGDIAAFWSDSTRARDLLGWAPRRTLADMCRSAWLWQTRHPEGFQ